MLDAVNLVGIYAIEQRVQRLSMLDHGMIDDRYPLASVVVKACPKGLLSLQCAREFACGHGFLAIELGPIPQSAGVVKTNNFGGVYAVAMRNVNGQLVWSTSWYPNFATLNLPMQATKQPSGYS